MYVDHKRLGKSTLSVFGLGSTHLFYFIFSTFFNNILVTEITFRSIREADDLYLRLQFYCISDRLQ